MQLKIKYHSGAKKIVQHGNWIDLFPRKEYHLHAPFPKVSTLHERTIIEFNSVLVDLGVSMKLPKYFEANIVPRSSTFTKQGVIQGNHFGVIDSEFAGESDILMFSAIALKETILNSKKAICQFSIQPSMNAPWYIKLKWLFTSKIEFVEVDLLTDIPRGGFGKSDSE